MSAAGGNLLVIKALKPDLSVIKFSTKPWPSTSPPLRPFLVEHPGQRRPAGQAAAAGLERPVDRLPGFAVGIGNWSRIPVRPRPVTFPCEGPLTPQSRVHIPAAQLGPAVSKQSDPRVNESSRG